MAHIVKAGEIESVGPTSPVRNNEEKAGPKRDPRTGRVLERSILGSAAISRNWRMLTSLRICGVECPSAYPILREILMRQRVGYRQEVVAERLRPSLQSSPSHRSP